MATRQALVDQHSCFILATNALATTPLPPPAVLDGDKGQGQSERGCRFLKAPPFCAASLYRKKPERIMALLMVMPVGLLVYAALEYRLRQTLTDPHAPVPDQQGKPPQNPTAKWGVHYFVGIPLLSVSGQWPRVLNVTAEHGNLLQLLGQPSMQLYGVKYA
jgi:transposase